MALSRFTTFTAGATLAAASLEGEFDNLVDALNGTDSVDITMTSASAATLTVNNTGSAKPQSWQIGGVEKIYVNATGQLQSSIATGTAPFVVASSTQVDNLNAQYVGGTIESDLAKLSTANNVFDAGANTSITLQGGTTANLITYDDDVGAVDGQYYRIRHSGQVVTWGGSSDGSTYDLMFRLNHASGSNGAAQISKDGGSNFYDIASENYVEGKLTTLSIGAFYEGALSTGAKQVRFIVPDGIDTGTITKVKTTYQSGTVTGDSIIYLRHYNAAGTEDASSPYSITLLSSQATGVATTTDITDITLAAGDQLEWEVNTASGHAEVSCWAQGTQSLI